MADESSFRLSRVQGSTSDSRRTQSYRSNDSPASEGQTTTKNVRPGDPHHYGTRLDPVASRAINPVCRCINPNNHGDAWAYTNTKRIKDINGVKITWKELIHRVLDHYGDRTSATREEEHEAYRHILTPRHYIPRIEHYHWLNYEVGRGSPVMISPYEDAVQMHNEDGHARNDVTENGLQTRMERPGRGGGRSPYEHSGC
jgi:hypothetical protein